MALNRYQKIFGVGPLGALLSILFLGFAWLVDWWLGHPQILTDPRPIKYVALVLFVLGLCLHFWTVSTLRHWWKEDELCTHGPYKYLRHPMYAAWISFVGLALALGLNSWVILIWSVLLHPIWHLLVAKEERIMENVFGDKYRQYLARTSRFVPRFFLKKRGKRGRLKGGHP